MYVCTGGYKRLQGIKKRVKREYRGLQKVTEDLWGLQGLTKGYKEYKGSQGVTKGYKALQGLTKSNKGLQRVT